MKVQFIVIITNKILFIIFVDFVDVEAKELGIKIIDQLKTEKELIPRK